jgi:hypothetical protein
VLVGVAVAAEAAQKAFVVEAEAAGVAVTEAGGGIMAAEDTATGTIVAGGVVTVVAGMPDGHSGVA